MAHEPDNEFMTAHTVLVIQDYTPEQLDVMTALLRRFRFEVGIASGGVQGLDMAVRHNPDLIISDVSLPDMDAVELCTHVRANATLSATPLLLASGRRRDSVAVMEGLKAGADDYLRMPYDAMHLLEKTVRLVERGRLGKLIRKLEDQFTRAQAALARSQEELQHSQKTEVLGQLIAGVAHEFNNLLAVIKGYGDLVAGRMNPTDPLLHYVRETLKASDRAAFLTQRLLTFSRRQSIQPRVFNLNATIEGLAEMLVRLIGENIELRTVLASGLGSVKADPNQIEQVIMNLALNARDAMPMGGRLTIETDNVQLDAEFVARHAYATPGDYVMIAVSDNGSGIDHDTKRRLFEPFFTTKPAGKGTGLGLSTIFSIVRQSSGSINVYSEPGIGTVFQVYLPRNDGTPEEYPQISETSATPRGIETVLLVEDETLLRNLTREVLEMQGYTVISAANGNEAIAHCEGRLDPVHLLLTDIVMPEMGGRALSKELLKAWPEMRVLYMTGYSQEALGPYGILDEGDRIIQKPFTVDLLMRTLRQILDGPL